MYSGKPQGTSHELAPELRVEQTCENNHKVNLDLFNDIFKYFVFQFLHENEKRKMNCISFSIFYDNEKRMRALKIQSKNLLNMKMVVNYLNFVFRIEVKTKSKYRILNFVFQFIKNTKWHFGYTDSHELNSSLIVRGNLNHFYTLF